MKSEGKMITPLRITQQEKKLEEYVNLLLIEGDDRCHYTWIKNLDRLLCYGDDNTRKFCPFCLTGFDTRYNKTLEEHIPLCRKYGGQKTILPSQGKNIIEFKDTHKWWVSFFFFHDHILTFLPYQFATPGCCLCRLWVHQSANRWWWWWDGSTQEWYNPKKQTCLFRIQLHCCISTLCKQSKNISRRGCRKTLSRKYHGGRNKNIKMVRGKWKEEA